LALPSDSIRAVRAKRRVLHRRIGAWNVVRDELEMTNLSEGVSLRSSAERDAVGFTLLELIIATSILLVLSTMAVPLARLTIQREKEHQLRMDLWEMRDAIDRYKLDADRGAFQTKVDSQNYPPDLETLIKGVDIQGKKVRYLRKIHSDPMTRTTEWGLRSMQDDPDSDSWGGQNVFDVYTKSQGSALDGTKYKDW
jgi:general secretion pathway protein G